MAQLDTRYTKRDARQFKEWRERRPWKARVAYNGRWYNVGRFATQEEAEREECRFLEEMIWGDPPMPGETSP